ncbi:hypothetical protein CT472_21775 [Salmonella enterica]|nr:hypothetical protein [Salmonella enterica]EDO1879253.1 hypothetical protein [Salmonella enterica]
MLLKSVKTSLFISGLFSFVPLTPGLSGVVRHPFEYNLQTRRPDVAGCSFWPALLLLPRFSASLPFCRR